MDNFIQDDFDEFADKETLFNAGVKLYDAKGGMLVFTGNGIFDKKPRQVASEDGSLAYQGHISILSLSMKNMAFMPNYFSIKGYYVEITDNKGIRFYFIESSTFGSNVNKVFCDYLKEDV